MIINKEMLVIKRPGTGIKPENIDLVIGKRTRSKVKENELLSLEKLE